MAGSLNHFVLDKVEWLHQRSLYMILIFQYQVAWTSMDTINFRNFQSASFFHEMIYSSSILSTMIGLESEDRKRSPAEMIRSCTPLARRKRCRRSVWLAHRRLCSKAAKVPLTVVAWRCQSRPARQEVPRRMWAGRPRPKELQGKDGVRSIEIAWKRVMFFVFVCGKWKVEEISEFCQFSKWF